MSSESGVNKSEVRSVLEAILAQPTAPGITFGAGLHGAECHRSREQLIERGARLAGELDARGVEREGRVILALPTGPEFVESLLACWMIGAAAIPVAAHDAGKRPGAFRERLGSILGTVKPHAIMGDERSLAAFSETAAVEGVVMVDARSAGAGGVLRTSGHDPQLPSHFQLTSGTTSAPRAAVIGHRALLANIEGIAERAGMRSSDRGLTWAPLYHDMGFAGGLCCPLAIGYACELLCTTEFAARPASWLEAMSRSGATLSPNPSFAYQLLSGPISRRVARDLDLSRWRYAWIGAEPVFRQQVQEFLRVYGPAGVRDTALKPSYGLAEATLAVTMPACELPVQVEWLDRGALQEHALAVAAEPEHSQSVASIACGKALAGTQIRIRTATGETAGERRVGKVLVKSASLMDGYFGEPDEDQPFADGWLDTGDLGFLVDGFLHITGREKDLIVRGGVKISPYEIEAAAETVRGVRAGRAAVFSVPDLGAGRERAVCIAESRLRGAAEVAELVGKIHHAAVELASVSLDDVVLVEPGAIPKTTSGKTQRASCRDIYVKGGFDRAEPAKGSESR